jgi:hypothetical protein
MGRSSKSKSTRYVDTALGYPVEVNPRRSSRSSRKSRYVDLAAYPYQNTIGSMGTPLLPPLMPNFMDPNMEALNFLSSYSGDPLLLLDPSIRSCLDTLELVDLPEGGNLKNTPFEKDFEQNMKGIKYAKTGIIMPIPPASAVCEAMSRVLKAIPDADRQKKIDELNIQIAKEYYEKTIGSNAFAKEKYIDDFSKKIGKIDVTKH